MGKKRFCSKRLLTIVLSAALVFTSVNVPQLTVEAAQTQPGSMEQTAGTNEEGDTSENGSAGETEAAEGTESTGETGAAAETEATEETVSTGETEGTGETETAEETESTEETNSTEEIESTEETEESIEETESADETETLEELTLDAAPADAKAANAEVIISEQEMQAFAGNAVTLSYEANDAGFAFGDDYTVNINGVPADKSSISIDANAGTITMPGSLFASAGVYEIQFAKAGFDISPVYQTVYAADSTDKWNLIWNDEFSGTALDSSKWDYQTGNGAAYGVAGWGNSEEEYYTDSTDNLAVGDGKLTITAKKDGAYAGANYTSARIRTVTEDIKDGKAELGTPLQIGTYGKVEAKMKLPAGKGVWPAFWMLPYDSEYGTWAASGELDIMEARGRLTDTVCGTIHYGGVWPNNGHNGLDYHFAEGESFEEYHIYSVEWDPTEIRWLVDGEVYNAISNWYSEAGEEGNWPYPAPFDEEFYILLNLAVGGTFDSDVASDQVEVDENGVSMDVDYVRWYQRDASVYENWEITGPETDKDESDTAKSLLAMADENGNFIKDGDFTAMSTSPYTTNGAWEIKQGYWAALLIPSNGNGDASWSKVTKDGKNFLKVAVANAGSQVYSSQMLQYFPVVKGYSYEISYTAYTDSTAQKADISMKIGGDDDNGWAVYSGNYTDELTTAPQTYTHKFTMNGETDATARFEFNLATSTGNVYLSDVSVKLTEINETDGEDDAKAPLSDGNHVYNGGFNIGQDSLLYWHWSDNDSSAKVSVKKEDGNRVADIQAASGSVSLWQYGINLLQTDTYELTFDVNSTEAQNIIVTLSNTGGTETYATETKSVAAGKSTVTVTFTQPADKTDVNGKLMFTFAKSASLDNVKLVRKTNNNVDFSTMEIWPIYNGDFFNGKDGWNIWSEGNGWQSAVVNAAGQLESQVLVNADATFYCAGIQSADMKLDKGIKYRVKFDYEIPSAKNYTLELAGEQREITLEAGAHTYVSEPFTGAGNCKFTLYLGPDQTELYTLKLDNVEVYIDPDFLTVPEGYAKPVSLAQDKKSAAGSPVVVKYSEDTAWEEAANKKYYIDGEEIDSSKVSLDKAANTLTIDGSCFAAAGSYAFMVGAEGYTKTKAISLAVLEASGNILLNGDFSDGTNSWEFYIADWTAGGSFSVNEGKEAVIEHKYDGGEDWHFQLFQNGLEYEAGSYVISFDAWADVERPIGVQLQNGNEVLAGTANKVVLSTEKKNYKIILEDLQAASGIKLDFPLGSMTYDGVSAPNDGANPYNIYFDNIVFRPATADDFNTKPGTIAAAGPTVVGNDVTVSYSEASESWKNAAKKVYVNGTEIAADKVTAADNGLVIDKSVFAVTGRYAIYVVAEGFEASNTVYKNIIGKDGNHILDGDMSNPDSWVVWDEDAENLSKGTIADGVYTLEYEAGYYKADWGMWVTWSSQLKKENISLEAGKTYVLSFDAKTSLAGGRDIILELNTNANQKTVHITEEDGTYEIEFENAAAVEDFYITFLLGAVGENLQVNDGSDGCAAPHTLTIDNVSLKVKGNGSGNEGEDDNKADKTELTSAVEKYKAYTKGAYTDNTWDAFQTALAAAEECLMNEQATSAEVAAALTALETAANELTEKVGLWIQAIPNQTYTGSAIKPSVTVWDGNKVLTEKKDYKVSYKKNVNVGTAEVTITGIGNYKEKDTAKFEIVSKNLADEDITAADVYAVISKKNTVKNPGVTVKYGKKTLSVKKDIEIVYPKVNGTDEKPAAGDYTITINAKKDGNYTGSKTISYKVLSNDTILMSKVKVSLTATKVACAGENTEKPSVKVTYGSKTLDEGVHYTVDYVNYDKAGKASVIVTAKDGSGYYGSKTLSYTVTGTAIGSKQIEVSGIASEYTYTGSGIEADTLIVKDTGRKAEGSTEAYTLVKGTDYEVSYSKNTNAGKASVIITGLGAYTGKVTKKFTIQKVDLAAYKAENSGLQFTCDESAVYTKNGAVPAYTVSYQGNALEIKKDFAVSFVKNKAVVKGEKTASIKITGKGNFKGSIMAEYEVTSPAADTVYAVAADVAVPSKASKLKASFKVYEETTEKALKAGTDYDKKAECFILEDGKERAVTDEDMTADKVIQVRITLKNNYAGNAEKPQTIETSFRLFKEKASTFKVDRIASQVYTGKAIEPSIVVKNKAGQVLERGTDYELIFSNNINKGTAKVTIKGIGNGYGGTKTVSFKITAAQMNWAEEAMQGIRNFFSNLF